MSSVSGSFGPADSPGGGPVGRGPVRAPQIAGSDGLRLAYAVELRKLGSQTPLKLLFLIVLLGPFAYAGVLGIQSGTPSDSLFGFWVHTSGFAVSLTLLGFAGSWAFPLIAGILAGDVFSADDRYGTWKTLLTRSCTREELFAGKVLAAATVVLGLSLLMTVTGLVAGIVFSGAHAMVNLSGALTSPGHMLALTIGAWIYALLPVVAYISLAVLFSVASRSGIIGVLGPAVVALATQLLALVGKGVTVHELLIGSGFDAWHGLFTSAPFFGPMIVSAVVCLAWTVICLGLSWRVLRRREFVGVDADRRGGWISPLRSVAVAILVLVVLGLACSIGPLGVKPRRVSTSLSTTFNRLTLYQQALIGRESPPTAQLNIRPNCNRRGAADSGPGDWTCSFYVYSPQPGSVAYQLTTVDYDVSVSYNGCWKAASPPKFIGGQTITGEDHRQVWNPLFIAYGCFNVL